MKVLNKFLIEDKNSFNIQNYLNTEENIKISFVTITKILLWIRNALAHYIKDIYRLHKLGKSPGGICISIDESYLVDYNGKKFGLSELKTMLLVK